MLTQLRCAVILFVLFTLITGVIYPLGVTGLAQALFPGQANGSLIWHNGQALGSSLIGQPFDDPAYFWGRLSATTPFPYNAGASSGANYSPLNPILVNRARARIQALREAEPDNRQPVPVDLATSSASGLDPHISVAAALFQAPRVARARGLGQAQVEALIRRSTEGRPLGILGEPRVNVLRLNLALNGVQ